MPMTNYGEGVFAKALEAFQVANQYVRVDFVKYLVMNPPPLRVYRASGHIDQMLTDRVLPQYKAEADTYQPEVKTLRVRHPWQKGEWIAALELQAAFDAPEGGKLLGGDHEVRLRFDATKGLLGGWVATEDSTRVVPVKAAAKPAVEPSLQERAAYVGLSVEQYVEVMRAAQEKLNR